MSYLEDFKKYVKKNHYPEVTKLWDEYCQGDVAEADELNEILELIKRSEMAIPFGRHVERILPLWEQIPASPLKHTIFRHITDLQSTDNQELREKIFSYLEEQYGEQKDFANKIRLIGLKTKENFQGAVSHYELLNHMAKGNFVFHSGGWGVGEIMDLSMLREQLSLEFDYVAGRKDLSFQNAFNTLIPIPDEHFLAQRFGNPDALEVKAKKKPLEVIHELLRDLGPLNASQIKDELYELVIPEDEWARWWQNTRAKMKKDTMISSPSDPKEPFSLRKNELSHEERLRRALEKKPDGETLIQMVYSFMRDFSEIFKNKEFSQSLTAKLEEMLSYPEITSNQELQIHFFLQDLKNEKKYAPVDEIIKSYNPLDELIKGINILAFKKRAAVEVRKLRDDWAALFLDFILIADQTPLRDYLLQELIKAKQEEPLKKKLEALIINPAISPETLIWYFQKALSRSSLPYGDHRGLSRLFESFLILLSQIEQSGERKDLIKKMVQIISASRYSVVRKIMENATLEEAKEFLLLATKCQSLSSHDIKIFHSLAELAYPSLKGEEEAPEEDLTIWTTQEGYKKAKERLEEIATVETIENAKEIEVARSHGDLRENAEFKSALERRDRLQGEIRFLSEQLNHARILSPADVQKDCVGVGVIVECETESGSKVSYTLLGPWEADPDKGILSFQSKLASKMKGLKPGDQFTFQNHSYSIKEIRSFFDK